MGSLRRMDSDNNTGPWSSAVSRLNNALRQLWRDEAGVTTVEYALLLVLVAMVSLVAWNNLASRQVEILAALENGLNP